MAQIEDIIGEILNNFNQVTFIAMKQLMKCFTIAAFGLIQLSASAFALPIESKRECKNNSCENFKIGMYRIQNTLTMNVLLEKEKGDKVKISLRNSKGKVIHEQLVGKSAKKFGLKLNFSEVEDGRYTLEVSDSHEAIVKNIDLSTHEVKESDTRTLVTMN